MSIQILYLALRTYAEAGGFAYAKTEGVVGIVNSFTIPYSLKLSNSPTNPNLDAHLSLYTRATGEYVQI